MKGTSSKALQTVVNQNPLLRQIVPFIRTPYKHTKQAFNKSNPLFVEMQDTRVQNF